MKRGTYQGYEKPEWGKVDMAFVNVYIDGFNFYYGLRAAGCAPYGWCDFRRLAQNHCSPADQIRRIAYFTAADEPNAAKKDRQIGIWWKALQYCGVELEQGYYAQHGKNEDEVDPLMKEKKWQEKQTDIRMAIGILRDAYASQPPNPLQSNRSVFFDKAVIITRDFDFVPVIDEITSAPISKQAVVLLPPNEGYDAGKWTQHQSRSSVIKQLRLADLKKALLPQIVKAANGDTVRAHNGWKFRDGV